MMKAMIPMSSFRRECRVIPQKGGSRNESAYEFLGVQGWGKSNRQGVLGTSLPLERERPSKETPWPRGADALGGGASARR